MAFGLTVALLGTAVGGTAIASNHYNSYNEPQIYRDGNFGQIASQLRQNLRNSGYQVINVQAKGSNQISVYAKKNNRPYELKYTYPELKLISSQQKVWSNVWQDKNSRNNGYNNHGYNSHNYNQNNNVKNKIKNESRYPYIEQSAINKINNQGYRVTDIELEEQDNREVFEIKAKRGEQEYDILLSYPDLNTIKFEKD